jgi:hypothetical protein
MTMSPVTELAEARTAYLAAVSPFYDETLAAVIEAVASSGSIGKADIGALLFWKRLRADTPWVTTLHALPDAQVRDVTARAVSQARDVTLSLPEAALQARSTLAVLPGFRSGDPMASALLVAAAPERMAVYDRRAGHGLQILGIDVPLRHGHYGRYMAVVEHLTKQMNAAGHAWNPRTVDTALFWLGR